MLYVLHMANHPSLTYRGGQRPITHLECDLRAVVRSAHAERRRWVFSLGNASMNAAEFRTGLAALDEINWSAVESRWFTEPEIRDGKQAEFLIERFFPWSLVERIGVFDNAVATAAAAAMADCAHRPPIEIRRDWYY